MTTPRPLRFPSRCAPALGALTAAILLLGFAPAAHAQTGVRLLPQVGVYAPLSDLGEVRDNGQTVWEAGRRSASLAVGLAVELGSPRERLSLRGQVGYASASPVPFGGAQCQDCSARSTLLTATGAVVLRPIPRLLIVQPHLIVGAGLKRYDFEPRNVQGDGWRAFLQDQTRFAGQVGVGVELSLLGLPTQWEVSGFISGLELGDGTSGQGAGSRQGDGDLQTDLFVTLSVPLGG